MTPEREALRDMWLSEMWGTVPEVPREEREQQRDDDLYHHELWAIRTQPINTESVDAA